MGRGGKARATGTALTRRNRKSKGGGKRDDPAGPCQSLLQAAENSLNPKK